MADINELLEEIRKAVHTRTRLGVIDNMIDPPTSREMDAAIYDAVSDINSYAPATSFTVESIGTDPDSRWFRALTLGAARNTLATLLVDWVSHGISVDLGDGVALESRKGDYETLEASLAEQFDTLVLRLKESSCNVSQVRHFRTIGRFSKPSSLGSRALRHNKSYRS